MATAISLLKKLITPSPKSASGRKTAPDRQREECGRYCDSGYPTGSTVNLFQQLISPPQVRDHNASAYNHGHIDRFFLLGAGHTQAVGLDRVVEDAIVTAQASRRHQPHQLFRLRRQRALQISIVIDVVEALY